MKNFSTRALARGAMIAALYAVLTLLLQPLSFGAIQFRFSEALTVMPMLAADAVPGLAVGCLLANLLGGAAVYDVVFGSLATLAAAFLTRKLRFNRFLAPLPAVLVNGLVVGAMLAFLFDVGESFGACFLYISAGQAIACYALGIPLSYALERVRWE